MTNRLNQNENGDESGIIEIKRELTKKGCENITKEKRWMRNCPQCKSEIIYKNKSYFHLATNKNTRCRKCYTKEINLGRIPALETRQKMSKSQLGRKHNFETKQKMSGKNNGMYGTHRYGELNPFYNKKHTEESKRKMRVASCKRVLQKVKNGRFANINPKEGDYFSILENTNKWNGIYHGKNRIQYFVNELGYFVDYYEPNLNIVVEYDEPRHYVYGHLKEKDVKRMLEIKNHLKCRFFRYNEYTEELSEF